MEIHIGVQQAREVVLNSDDAPDSIAKAISKAWASEEMLTLTDSRGRTIMIPTDKIAYVEIGAAEDRRVGFAG